MGVWSKQASADGDAVLTTNYSDDYLVRGNAHEVHRRMPISIGTEYWVFDTTGVTKAAVFSLPIVGNCSNDQVYLDTYAIESYAGGTVVPSTNPNGIDGEDAEAVLKTGVTPTGTPGDDLRQYIFGTQAQGANLGGGEHSGAHPKLFPPGAIIVVKIVSTATLDFEFNFLWYEV